MKPSGPWVFFFFLTFLQTRLIFCFVLFCFKQLWDYSLTFYIIADKIGKYQLDQLVFRSGSPLIFYFCVFLLQAVELLENCLDWFCRPYFHLLLLLRQILVLAAGTRNALCSFRFTRISQHCLGWNPNSSFCCMISCTCLAFKPTDGPESCLVHYSPAVA